MKKQTIIRLDPEPPARKVGMNRRSLTGKFAIDGKLALYESALERDFLVLVEADPTALKIKAQPFRLDYLDSEGFQKRYFPDFLVEYARGKKVIYEVKYRSTLKEEWTKLKPKFRGAVRYAQKHGMRFSIMTEVEIRHEHYLPNAKFLRSYRQIEADYAREQHLLSTLAVLGDTPEATPEGLLQAAYCCFENRMMAVRYLWRLIAHGLIGTDLYHRLTMTSRIWIPAGKENQWRDPHSYRFNGER